MESLQFGFLKYITLLSSTRTQIGVSQNLWVRRDCFFSYEAEFAFCLIKFGDRTVNRSIDYRSIYTIIVLVRKWLIVVHVIGARSF